MHRCGTVCQASSRKRMIPPKFSIKHYLLLYVAILYVFMHKFATLFSFLFPLFLGCLHYSTQTLMVLVILQKYCKFFLPSSPWIFRPLSGRIRIKRNKHPWKGAIHEKITLHPHPHP